MNGTWWMGHCNVSRVFFSAPWIFSELRFKSHCFHDVAPGSPNLTHSFARSVKCWADSRGQHFRLTSCTPDSNTCKNKQRSFPWAMSSAWERSPKMTQRWPKLFTDLVIGTTVGDHWKSFIDREQWCGIVSMHCNGQQLPLPRLVQTMTRRGFIIKTRSSIVAETWAMWRGEWWRGWYWMLRINKTRRSGSTTNCSDSDNGKTWIVKVAEAVIQEGFDILKSYYDTEQQFIYG